MQKVNSDVPNEKREILYNQVGKARRCFLLLFLPGEATVEANAEDTSKVKNWN